MQKILEDIELGDEENTFDISFNFDSKLFIAVENSVEPKKLFYKLTDTEENIATNHREEILEYCLASFTKEDTVGLGDIFLHGKYIKQL